MTQCVPPPWPLLRCANERTNAILSATLAISGNVPPSVTPGSAVETSPVTLRNSEGAVIFGSNVSTCVGHPPATARRPKYPLRCGRSGPLGLGQPAGRAGSPPRPRVRRLSESLGGSNHHSRESGGRPGSSAWDHLHFRGDPHFRHNKCAWRELSI